MILLRQSASKPRFSFFTACFSPKMKRLHRAHPSARGEPPEKNPEASLANTFQWHVPLPTVCCQLPGREGSSWAGTRSRRRARGRGSRAEPGAGCGAGSARRTRGCYLQAGCEAPTSRCLKTYLQDRIKIPLPSPGWRELGRRFPKLAPLPACAEAGAVTPPRSCL